MKPVIIGDRAGTKFTRLILTVEYSGDAISNNSI